MSSADSRTNLARDEAARASLLSKLDFPGSGALGPSSLQLAYSLNGNEPQVVYVVLQRELVINSHLASGSVVFAPSQLVSCAPIGWQTYCRTVRPLYSHLQADPFLCVHEAAVQLGSTPTQRLNPIGGSLSATVTRRKSSEGQEKRHFGLAWAPEQAEPHQIEGREESFELPQTRLKGALQELGLSYIELSYVLGVSRQTIYQWMNHPIVDIRDVNARRILRLAEIGAEWRRRVGDQPIPRWCWGNGLVADGRLLDHLKDAVQDGRALGGVLGQVEKYVRRGSNDNKLAHVPMPLSDQELAMRVLSRKKPGEG